ncbi:MAG: pentapeptide repeat-containing protein [Cyanobacteriota bacterium]|nr:pentapeptide repeat-containing protein [Cyanobacteriota bacterium]
MGTPLKNFWQFLQTDVRELFTPVGAAESGAEITQAVLELGVAMGLFVPQIAIPAAGLSFVGIGVKAIQAYRNKFNKEPSLEQCVALLAPPAYLQSLNELYDKNPILRQYLDNSRHNESNPDAVEGLGEFQLDETLARNALECFQKSELGRAFNQKLSAQLVRGGMKQPEAEIVGAWVARGTQFYLQQALAEAGEEIQQLAQMYAVGGEPDKFSSIETYLTEQIATKPRETVFDEAFCFQDVYVPLEVKPVKTNGKVDENATSQNIEEWAKTMLLDATKQRQVLFIQGGPGRGKSVFCRMFSDWVRRELHPIYTPILIRLRDLTDFENNFDDTLKAATGTNFASNNNWLTDSDTRFLFLLDGFDELLLERGANADLRHFLEQVEGFQRRCAEITERQHRVLITGRPFALFGIERLMPANLERVEIMPMGREIQNQWLEKWQAVVDSDPAEAEVKTNAFRKFLQNKYCPEAVKTLAKEPLLLYLLAAMHRDNQIDGTMFASASAGDAKVLIYQQALEWVLTKQRGRNLNQKLTQLEPEDLHAILAEAGLCVVQSGQEQARISTVEARLVERGDEDIKKQIETARHQSEDDALKNALAVFYLKSVPGAENYVEFFHKSFGEFLCAERMVESLVEWAETEKRRGKTQYRISTSELEWQIYDLLGYGALTGEIVEYVRALLEQQEGVDVVVLFERLHEFYLQWCAGEFIEATTETLPQRKARQLQQQEIQRGQREVDIYAGLNILILLLELHRYGKKREELKDKIAFYPCGQPGSEDFDSKRLLRIMGYSQCLSAIAFTSISGNFLSGAFLSGAFLSGANLSDAFLSDASLSDADLSSVDLSGADLSGADLSGTYLIGAYFRGAYLREANFSSAFLSGASFRGAILIGAILSSADLRGAYLTGAYLSGADLSNINCTRANLSGADLSSANLSGADLSGAYLNQPKWDDNTQWSNAWGLDKAIDVPDELAREPKFAATVTLNQGVSLAQQGSIDTALAAYEEAQHLDRNLEISARFWNELCWCGSLHNRAADVLFAGEKAVELEPNNGSYRKTRGLAKALMGDIAGAIEDFQATLDSGIFGEEEQQQRQRWLETLRAGNNPFTPEELAALREGTG